MQKLSNLVRLIPGYNPGAYTLSGSNIYLVGNSKKRILIDTGEKGKTKFTNELKNTLLNENAVIDKILLTHSHQDHTGGLMDVLNLGNNFIDKNVEISKIKLPEKIENAKTSIVDEFKSTLGEPGTRGYGGFENIDFNEIPGGALITNSDNSFTLKAIYTPGHSIDHTCFYLEQENTLFSGDCILGKSSCIVEDLFAYMESLNTLKLLNATSIYPGHGPVEDGGVVDRYINHRNFRTNQVLNHFQKNLNVSLHPAIFVKNIYMAEGVSPKLYLAAGANVLCSCIKLYQEGLIERDLSKSKMHFVMRSQSQESEIKN